MVNIILVGFGYWGPNYLRVFRELTKCNIRYCCDLDNGKLEGIKKIYPGIEIARDYKVLLRDYKIDAAVIATPLATHYKIAKYFLEHKKHVLVEKPLTSTSKEAEKLISIAKKNKLVFMVGHVYKHNPGITRLRDIIKEGKLGKIYYLKAERMGLGPIRKETSALWDLATHEIYIALYLLGKMPLSVYAHGGSYIRKKIEDFVDLNLIFPGNVSCTIYASWFAPEKIRRITVVGSKGMAIFDDLNKSEMLKIYEREINETLLHSTPKYADHQNIVNIGDVYTPGIKQSEPLRNQAEYFLECIENNMQPINDGRNGLNVVKILETAQESLKTGKNKCLLKM
jgi:predicted dehydrogenase